MLLQAIRNVFVKGCLQRYLGKRRVCNLPFRQWLKKSPKQRFFGIIKYIKMND